MNQFLDFMGGDNPISINPQLVDSLTVSRSAPGGKGKQTYLLSRDEAQRLLSDLAARIEFQEASQLPMVTGSLSICHKSPRSSEVEETKLDIIANRWVMHPVLPAPAYLLDDNFWERVVAFATPAD